MPQVLNRLLRSKAILIGAIVLVVYALVGFLLLPKLIQHYLPVYAQEQLQRQASIGKVRVNPFLLSLEVNDFSLQESAGQPIATAQRLYIDFEASSLLRWAWTFADIHITALSLHIDIDRAGRSNLGKLGEAFASDSSAPAADEPVRLLLQHAQLSDGRLIYSDHSLATPASTTLEPISLELENLSTLPDRQSPYAIIARLPEGGTLVWRGEVALAPLMSQGELYIGGFKPTAFWSFLQDQVNIAPPSGVLELYARYHYDLSAGATQFELQKIFLSAAGLEITAANDQHRLLTLENFAARDGRFALSSRELTFPKVALRNGAITARRSKQGTLDWQQLAKSAPTSSTTAPTAPQDPAPAPWKINLETLELENLSAQVTDLRPAQPVTLALGTIAGHTQFTTILGAQTTLTAQGLDLQLANMTVVQARQKRPLIALDHFHLSGGRVDTQAQELAVQKLTLAGGRSNLTIDPNGELSLLTGLGLGDTQGSVSDSGKTTGNPWRIQLAKLEARDFSTRFTDQRYKPALRYDLEKFTANIEQLSSETSQPARFDASVQVAQGGSISGSGTFRLDGPQVTAAIALDKISLKPLKSLIGHFTTLTLHTGEASLNAQLDYTQSAEAPALNIEGAANIDHLLLKETLTNDRFLSWRTLTTDELKFSLNPDQLAIQQLRLVRPGSKIMIFEDRSVNLAKIMKQIKSDRPANTARTDNSFPVTIDRLRIEKGNVDFTDLSLVLPFAAQVLDLQGAINGISSAPSSRANLKLEGRVDDYGSAQVEGGINLFAPKQYTDIRTRFRNVEMQLLSPYTATFAGRKVASGKLSLDLEYQVKDSQLVGNNSVMLKNFTLGEPIDSPDALDLPLDLAVALLTDSQGRINLAVPVRGDVSNPAFSYGKVIGKAIAGMLGKIVTAPFHALGRLLGSNIEKKLDTVTFESGSAEVQPPQIETLQQVGELVQQRPQLGLTISGRYDPQLDSLALRREQVRRALAAALDLKLEADEEAPPAAVDQAKTQRELEKLLEQRAGDKATDSFQAEFEKTAGRAAEPVNPALALLGKASPDADYYQAMFERLVKLQALEEGELRALAQRRADNIHQTLSTRTGLSDSRITLGEIGTTQGSKEKGVESKILLGAREEMASAPDNAQESQP